MPGLAREKIASKKESLSLMKVKEAQPEPESRFARLLALLERVFQLADRLIESRVSPALNPLAHTGAIATGSFLVAALTGVLILPWYSVSAQGAWASLEAMSQMPLTAGLIRSLHRYSSDFSILFATLHALRLLSARRFGGARALAWITGVGLVLILWFVGWLGYWLVWDQRAQRVATGTAKMLDGLPIFADPLSRSFITNEGLNSLLFFMVFFFHMLVPLAMAILLWIHISHLSRSRFLPSKSMAWLVGGSMLVLALLHPATSAPAADLLRPVGRLSVDAFYLLPLALSDRLGGGALWLILLAVLVVAGGIPFLLPKGRAKPAKVDPARCNGCTHCYEDCPYDAIRMLPRDDDRPYDQVAQVDPSRCVGCGICAGSCDSAGIFLPHLPVLDERERIEGWLADAKKQGEEVNLAFVCAFSAGSRFQIDPESGKSESLPGYRVVPVPCSGWVQRFTLERAMRRGAASALIVGCGGSEPHFREGGKWTDLRLKAERDPGLRHDKVDLDRIHFVQLDSSRWLELMRIAARLRRGETEEASSADEKGNSEQKNALLGGRKSEQASVSLKVLPASVGQLSSQARNPERAVETEGSEGSGGAGKSGKAGRLRRGFGTFAVAAAMALVVGLGSELPYWPPKPQSELVVSFKHPGQVGEHCRQLSEAEKARLPIHMKQEEVCERARASVRLQVKVDGELRHQEAYEPRGLRGDGNSVAVVRLPIEAGKRHIEVAIGDDHQGGWQFADSKELQMAEGSSVALIFDRVSGFGWHQPLTNEVR